MAGGRRPPARAAPGFAVRNGPIIALVDVAGKLALLRWTFGEFVKHQDDPLIMHLRFFNFLFDQIFYKKCNIFINFCKTKSVNITDKSIRCPNR